MPITNIATRSTLLLTKYKQSRQQSYLHHTAKVETINNNSGQVKQREHKNTHYASYYMLSGKI